MPPISMYKWKFTSFTARTPSRSEELWFADGNIILESKNKLFRVHHHKLAEVSPVFRNRLESLKHKPTKSNRCPTMQLEHDSDELELFLTAILVPHSFARKIKPPSGEVNFSILSIALRMATQFEVTYLRKMLIRQLTIICPTFLQAYDMNRRSFMTTTLPPDQLPFAIVRLAREVDVQAVLPFALYRCSTLPLKTLLDGDLDWEDKKLCLTARQEFHNRLRDSIFAFLIGRVGKDAFSHCRSQNQCMLERLAFLSRNEDSFASWKKGPIDYEVDWQAVAKRLCGPCTVVFRASFERARQDLWNNLPSSFGLPPWQQLLYAKAL